MHNSFAITWGILGVTILVLLLITNYSNIPKELYMTRNANPCRELIVNNAERVDAILSQMEQWPILSNVVNYVQYNRYPRNFHNLILKL